MTDEQEPVSLIRRSEAWHSFMRSGLQESSLHPTSWFHLDYTRESGELGLTGHEAEEYLKLRRQQEEIRNDPEKLNKYLKVLGKKLQKV